MASSKQKIERSLTAVDGIGNKVAERFVQRGIESLSQLARTPASELAAMLDGLPGGFTVNRIDRGRWREQAANLASAERARREDAEEKVATAPPALRDAPQLRSVRHNFTVEATLDAVTGSVVASQVDHVQSGDQMPWRRWDRDGVLAFIEERMDVAPSGVALRRGHAASART